jgi:16S rRNA (cytidine1402-2'-O)-methyltransferase
VPTGQLFIVATPIGNLGDLSQRAAEILGRVAVVAAEDTRRTRALLSHLGIRGKRLVKMDAHASAGAVSALVEALAGGEDVALVTDAGTPGVSDPGAALVRSAAESGIPVLGIPGPSAVTTAAALSGLVEGPFLFLGFLPRKGDRRRQALERIRNAEEPVILFESPQRIAKTLAELRELDPRRPAALCRELTKIHEETLRGTVAELTERAEGLRGEITLVLASGAEAPPADEAETDALIADRLGRGHSLRDVASEVAVLTGHPKRFVYRRVLELRAEGLPPGDPSGSE